MEKKTSPNEFVVGALFILPRNFISVSFNVVSVVDICHPFTTIKNYDIFNTLFQLWVSLFLNFLLYLYYISTSTCIHAFEQNNSQILASRSCVHNLLYVFFYFSSWWLSWAFEPLIRLGDNWLYDFFFGVTIFNLFCWVYFVFASSAKVIFCYASMGC